jgi:hypothetical protein
VGSFLGVMGGKNALLSDKLVNGLNRTHLQALHTIADDFISTLNLLTEKLAQTHKELQIPDTKAINERYMSLKSNY